MNLLQNRMDLHEVDVLDLFCGTGAISLEVASRGAKSVVAADKNAMLLKFIRATASDLGLPIKTLRVDVFRWIKKNRGTFGLVFADPPYHIDHHADIPKFVFETGMLAEGGWLIVEHPAQIDFSKHPKFESHREYGAVHFSFFTH